MAELTDINHAYERALNYITARAHTAREVDNALKRYGFEPDVRERTIARIIDAGLISDADIAARYVAAKVGYGRMRLKSAMKVKGISDEIIGDALTQRDDRDEIAAARTLADKKLKQLNADDPREAKRKVIAYLARRGFTYDVIRSAMNASFDEDYFEESP